MFNPICDRDGLKQALVETMERSLALRRLERSLKPEDDGAREEVLRQLPQPTLTSGYYMLGNYFLWLQARLEALKLPLADATSLEAEGLVVLNAACAEFEREHPCCPSCGERQDGRYWLRCFECGFEVKR